MACGPWPANPSGEHGEVAGGAVIVGRQGEELARPGRRAATGPSAGGGPVHGMRRPTRTARRPRLVEPPAREALRGHRRRSAAGRDSPARRGRSRDECRCQVERADPGAPQAVRWPPDAEAVAEVARDRPDVGARCCTSTSTSTSSTARCRRMAARRRAGT